MTRSSSPARKGPGRPPKFGRPSRVVAVTLPEDVIERLQRVHHDLAWAIVKLVDGDARRRAGPGESEQPDVELVTISDRRSLIVVNHDVIRTLPGVSIIPLFGSRAFLAVDIDRDMGDLELSVLDRLEQPHLDRGERKALTLLRTSLSEWRRDPELRIQTRAIIVIEREVAGSTRRTTAPMRGGRRSLAQRRRQATTTPA